MGLFQLIRTVLEQEVYVKLGNQLRTLPSSGESRIVHFVFSLLVKALQAGNKNAERIKRHGCKVPKTCFRSLLKGFISPNLGDREEEKEEESIEEVK